MIGFLKGFLIEKKPEHIILLVNGVGYEIEVPASSLCLFPPINQEISLYILTYVREDAIRLFGFISYFDKLVFNSLIQVSGIGPKAALALLGNVDGFELSDFIIHNQIAQLTSIPGIGAKTAERLILELKSKLQKLVQRYDSERSQTLFENQETSIENMNGNLNHIEKNKHLIKTQVIEDLKSALVNLGYKEKQYASVVNQFSNKIYSEENLTFEIALKQVLKKLSEHALKN